MDWNRKTKLELIYLCKSHGVVVKSVDKKDVLLNKAKRAVNAYHKNEIRRFIAKNNKGFTQKLCKEMPSFVKLYNSKNKKMKNSHVCSQETI